MPEQQRSCDTDNDDSAVFRSPSNYMPYLSLMQSGLLKHNLDIKYKLDLKVSCIKTRVEYMQTKLQIEDNCGCRQLCGQGSFLALSELLYRSLVMVK